MGQGPQLPHCELSHGEEAFPGRWVRQQSLPAYHLNLSTWAELGMNEIRDQPEHRHNWGRCPRTRPQYMWTAHRCKLLELDRFSVCQQRLLGRQALFVGDSTTAQLFVSVVLLLGGRFGKNRVRGGTFVMATASACDDDLRLSFVRSDLLLWTQLTAPAAAAQRCSTGMLNYRFTQQAVLDADVLIMGLGQHFASLIFSAQSHRRHQAYAFFTGNLNRTLASARALRAMHGRPDPASIIVVGASVPVAGCELATSPSSATAAAFTAATSRHPYGASWWHLSRINQLARWMAVEAGVSFMDLATLSSMRADDTLGHYWPAHRAGGATDCVHYCLPGVVDTFSRLLFHILFRTARQGRGAPTSVLSSSGHHRKLRFFNHTGWLTTRGASRHLEGCDSLCARMFGSDDSLAAQWWWPYKNSNCTLHSRANSVSKDEASQ